MKYGVLENRGFLLLTGDVGTGKTTLINALLNGLGDEVVAAFVPDPGLSTMDFFNYIVGAFGIKKRFTSKGDFLFYFRHFLNQANQANKKVLLIIDESQRLTHELLEEIRLLSNIENQSAKLINIFFVGQNEFNDLLWEPRNRALRQRITVNYNVYSLTEEEIGEYIRHRLRVAGTEKMIFTPEAINGVMKFSEGFPRMINIICDHALLTGFVKGVSLIGPGIIRECTQDLHIPRDEKPAEAATDSTDLEIGAVQKEMSEDAPAEKRQTENANGIFAGYKIQIVVACLLVIFTAIYFLENSGSGYRKDLEGYWRAVKGTYRKVQDHIFGGRKQADGLKSSQDDRPSEKRLPKGTETSRDAGGGSEISDEKLASLRKAAAIGAAPTASSVSKERESEDDSKLHASDIPGKPIEIMADTEASVPARPIVPVGSVITEGPISFAQGQKISPDRTYRNQRTIINFTHNSNELPDDAVNALDRIAGVMLSDAAWKLNVTGYTDSSGVYSYNKSLSLFRANIVKSYLVGKGVNPESVMSFGRGPENPKDSNNSVSGRKINRRVEIEFVYGKP